MVWTANKQRTVVQWKANLKHFSVLLRQSQRNCVRFHVFTFLVEVQLDLQGQRHPTSWSSRTMRQRNLLSTLQSRPIREFPRSRRARDLTRAFGGIVLAYETVGAAWEIYFTVSTRVDCCALLQFNNRTLGCKCSRPTLFKDFSC